MRNTLKNLAIVALVCFILFDLTTYAKPSPPNALNAVLPASGCRNNIKRDHLCQLCAKKTKSPIAYPQCCDMIDGVYDWCDKFVSYGLYQSDK